MTAAVLAALIAQQPTTFAADFQTALGIAGLTTQTARYDLDTTPFYRQGDGTTPTFAALHGNPWRNPFFADMLRRQLNTAVGRPQAAVEAGGRAIGLGSRRSLLGDPIAEQSVAARADGSLRRVLEGMRDRGLVTGPLPDLAPVPAEVQKAAALLLLVAESAVEVRRAALLGCDPATVYRLATTSIPERPTAVQERTAREASARIDVRYLIAAAQDVLAACEVAETSLRSVSSTVRYDARIETAWGRIVLTGGGASTHDGVATLLVIDTGGDDTYLNTPANQSSANWLSVVLDTAGNDRYLSDPALGASRVDQFAGRRVGRGRPGPGAAALGIVALFDADGNDLYRSHLASFGSATFGVAYLRDQAGDDVYDSYADAQGYARHGVGVLEDKQGDDRYRCFTTSQGCGLPSGFGALIDRAGRDSYTADDKTLDFPSPQSADHNVSLAQGAGYGIRGDFLYGNSVMGGVGLLHDLAGDDQYSCGVFGQGVGYWGGVGFLWDDAGDDRSDGVWYVQGASAHFGVGYYEDGGGNDLTVATMNMAQGAGHDFGTGFFLDRAGNDTRQAPNLSLGAGNENGIGVYLDLLGDDTVSARGTTLGSSNAATKGSLREFSFGLGLYLDLQGQDTYPEGVPWARNGGRAVNWATQNPVPGESQVGVFWDR